MIVLFTTNYGSIKIELENQRAPKTVENFLFYINTGYYDGTIFHRVIPNFMVQAGGFEAAMQQKSTMKDPIENEASNGLKNKAYSLAMARTSAPHSASSQFFINVKDNQFLDYPAQDGWGYCVFGKVIEGTDIIDKIASVQTTRVGMHSDVPVNDILIEKTAVID
jgi:peptidyl-prolyl cis-trans isomerase B (cyclophilin B)